MDGDVAGDVAAGKRRASVSDLCEGADIGAVARTAGDRQCAVCKNVDSAAAHAGIADLNNRGGAFGQKRDDTIGRDRNAAAYGARTGCIADLNRGIESDAIARGDARVRRERYAATGTIESGDRDIAGGARRTADIADADISAVLLDIQIDLAVRRRDRDVSADRRREAIAKISNQGLSGQGTSVAGLCWGAVYGEADIAIGIDLNGAVGRKASRDPRLTAIIRGNGKLPGRTNDDVAAGASGDQIGAIDSSDAIADSGKTAVLRRE